MQVMTSGKIFVHDCTAVTALDLILFGAGLVAESSASTALRTSLRVASNREVNSVEK